MDRAEALQRIPRAYSLALRLRDAGVPDALIAECVSVEPEALAPHYLVAQAKLAYVMARATSGSFDDAEPSTIDECTRGGR
ncbi:MAG: hypothetical protein ACRDSE_22905 [Pseudonocardiaceae bacterium]